MDIRERAAAVRETAADLPDTDIYMVSLKNREKSTTAGLTVLMPRAIAAGAIVDLTHRVARQDEIDAHIADQQAKGDAIRAADLATKFPLNLNLYTHHQGKDAVVERAPTPAPAPASRPSRT